MKILVLMLSLSFSLAALSAKRVQKLECEIDDFSVEIYYYTGLVSGWRKVDFTKVYHHGKLFATSDPSWIPGYTGACMFGTNYDKEKEILSFSCSRKLQKSVLSGNSRGTVRIAGAITGEWDENGYLEKLDISRVNLKVYMDGKLEHKEKSGFDSCRMVN